MKKKDTVLIQSLIKDETESMITKKTLVGYLKKLGVKQSVIDRVGGCCNKLVFATDDGLTKKREVFAITCQNRFCPVCQKRESYNHFYNLFLASKLIMDSEKYDVFFTTFTVVNMCGDLLDEALKAINASINDLLKISPFCKFDSQVIKVEITYNRRAKTFHPHVHAVFFSKRSKKVSLTKSKLLKEWNKVYKKNCSFYEKVTQVDVKKIPVNSIDKSLIEVSKYSVKSGDFVESLSTFKVFYHSLYYKKLFRVNGELGVIFRCVDELKKDKAFKVLFDDYLELDSDKPLYTRLFKALFSLSKECYSINELIDDDEKEARFFELLVELNREYSIDFDELESFVLKKLDTFVTAIDSIENEFMIHLGSSHEKKFSKKKRTLLKKKKDYEFFLSVLQKKNNKKKRKKKNN